ncbi:hypothetical protein F4778DRAFT_770918 [Xylariomycetidae sp. FL2044]|nr:hypothetical protein F4778DRAFT_770918 [Xylariomycetidae sp. FL2044]
MASEKGFVATEAPTPFSAIASQPSIPQAPVSVESLAAEAARAADAARATQSLKRQREATPTSPSTVLPPPIDPELSPSKSAKLGIAPRQPPAPMTGAAAIEDERRREEEQYKLEVSGASENPAYRAQTALMSASALAMSRPQDAPPAPDAQPQSPSVSIPTTTAENTDPKPDISPQSATSMASLSGSAPAPVPMTGSPGPMDIDAPNSNAGFGTQPPAQMEEKSAISLSYPGILPANPNMPAPPARGMSMPMTPNQQGAPRSPNSKKHKCPYCETEFTRHHNLKSHLLTHSQEKPYVCQTCQMRFRRLHDLKRHSKLHTGEKPHVCPKCDRKFARGDALARHSKGPGGCVGRRSSLGGFLGEEDPEGASHMEGDDSVMSGVVYDGTNDPNMTEEERQRLSNVPSIKAQHVQGIVATLRNSLEYSPTFLPPGASTGRLYPPNLDRGSVGSNASQTPGTSISSLPMAGGNPAMYAQNAITESPKPLSPSALQGQDGNINRQRSPSLTAQFQQQQFGRHQSDRNTPPGSYPAPEPASHSASGSSTQPQVIPGQGSGHSHTSSAAGQNGGSGDSTSNNLFATDQGIWAYIHSLEEHVRQLSERVQAMEASEKSKEEKIAHLEASERSNEEKIAQLLRNQNEPKADLTEKIL